MQMILCINDTEYQFFENTFVSAQGEVSPASTSVSNSSETSILTLLAGLGLKATRPRHLIAGRIAEMGEGGSDFTIEDLWHELQARDPGIGRATVFRTVDILVREGILDRIPLSDGKHLYRVCGRHHHHHVTCTTCRRVVEIEDCLSPELLKSIASTTSFEIEGHSLELFGSCPICREAPTSTRTA